MKKILLFLLVFVLSLSFFGACSKSSDTQVIIKEYNDYYKGVELDNVVDYIVKDDTTAYSIVIPSGCGEAVQFAAAELESFIYTSSGVSLQILYDSEVTSASSGKYISISNTSLYQNSGIVFDYSTLNGDGFILKTVDDDLYINAYRDRGILYGVYDFLEKFLGIRFLTSDYTHIPRNETVSLYKMDVVEIPAFAMRTFLQYSTYAGLADLDFYTRSRNTNAFTTVSEKYGGNLSVYGRQDTHNFHCYVPREIYYETHPEFYHYDAAWDIGQDNGWTIDLLNGITEDGQLDESMDISVAKIVIEEMKKDILAKPDINYFVFEQEDGNIYYQYSSDSNQQKIVDKYGRSGILIRFCNVIVRELQKWANEELNGRKINLVTFAYGYTKNPPVKTVNGKQVPIDETVVAAENLIIRMALAGNRYYSYFDDRSGQKELINGWTAITNNFFFWGYEADFAEYLWYMPFFNIIYDDIQGLSKLNIYYMLNQGCYDGNNNWMSQMKGYLYSRLYWNPNYNVKSLIENYLTLYYGIAAPYVKEMMYLFEENYAKAFSADPDLSISVAMSTGKGYKQAETCKIGLLEKALKYITDAEKMVKDTIADASERDTLLIRLARVKVTPMRMIMYHYQTYYPLASQSDEIEFAKQFFDTCELGGVTHYCEAGLIANMKKNYKLD